MPVASTQVDPNTGKRYLLCRSCGQPMLPPGVVKRPNEYDHARGCPEAAPPASERQEAK